MNKLQIQTTHSRVSPRMPPRGDSVSGSRGLGSVPRILLSALSSRRILDPDAQRSRAGEGEAGEE